MAIEYLMVSGSTKDLDVYEKYLAAAKYQRYLGIERLVNFEWEKSYMIYFPNQQGAKAIQLPVARDRQPRTYRPPFKVSPEMFKRAMATGSSPIDVEALGYESAVVRCCQEADGNTAAFDGVVAAIEGRRSDGKPGPEYAIRRYRFEVNGAGCSQEVRVRAADWVKLNQAAFPSLAVDKVNTMKASPDTGYVPVPYEPIPEYKNWGDYVGQKYFKRIGLKATTGAASSKAAAKPYGSPLFAIHERAQGEGTIIFVVDTAPLPGQTAPNVDFSSVEAIIDLQPELETGTTGPILAGGVYHGLMIANLCKAIAPKARIILIRAMDDAGRGDTGDLSSLISYLVNSVPGRLTYASLGLPLPPNSTSQYWIKADEKLIFNMSLEVPGSQVEEVQAPSFERFIAAATFRKTVFVCASGNDSMRGAAEEPAEPAAYGYYPGYTPAEYKAMEETEPNEEPPSNTPLYREPYNMVIGVASSAKAASYLYAKYSNASPVAAPGEEILLDPGTALTLRDVERDAHNQIMYDETSGQPIPKTTPSGVQPVVVMGTSEYVTWSGTSFAAPLVAGQVALLLGRRLDDAGSPVSPLEVKEHIWNTAETARYWNRPREIRIDESL